MCNYGSWVGSPCFSWWENGYQGIPFTKLREGGVQKVQLWKGKYRYPKLISISSYANSWMTTLFHYTMSHLLLNRLILQHIAYCLLDWYSATSWKMLVREMRRELRDSKSRRDGCVFSSSNAVRSLSSYVKKKRKYIRKYVHAVCLWLLLRSHLNQWKRKERQLQLCHSLPCQIRKPFVCHFALKFMFCCFLLSKSGQFSLCEPVNPCQNGGRCFSPARPISSASVATRTTTAGSANYPSQVCVVWNMLSWVCCT